mgnify:CR=1 FL=1
MSGNDKNRAAIPIRVSGAKELGADKMARNTARFESDAPRLRKPSWIRVRLPSGRGGRPIAAARSETNSILPDGVWNSSVG